MKGLVLFDGECNVCDTFVNFLIDRDPDGKLQYASQQSSAGKDVMTKRDINVNCSTMVLITSDGSIYTHSTAFLRTVALLGSFYRLLLLFLIIPAFIRDLGYSCFAANRYRLFGRHEEACKRLTPELKLRFLQYNTESKIYWENNKRD